MMCPAWSGPNKPSAVPKAANRGTITADLQRPGKFANSPMRRRFRQSEHRSYPPVAHDLLQSAVQSRSHTTANSANCDGRIAQPLARPKKIQARGPLFHNGCSRPNKGVADLRPAEKSPVSHDPAQHKSCAAQPQSGSDRVPPETVRLASFAQIHDPANRPQQTPGPVQTTGNPSSCSKPAQNMAVLLLRDGALKPETAQRADSIR